MICLTSVRGGLFDCFHCYKYCPYCAYCAYCLFFISISATVLLYCLFLYVCIFFFFSFDATILVNKDVYFCSHIRTLCSSLFVVVLAVVVKQLLS